MEERSLEGMKEGKRTIEEEMRRVNKEEGGERDDSLP